MEFKKGQWTNEVNVRDFIVENYCPYDGDDSFLTPPTDSTVRLWDNVKILMEEERKKGISCRKKVSRFFRRSLINLDRSIRRCFGK